MVCTGFCFLLYSELTAPTCSSPPLVQIPRSNLYLILSSQLSPSLDNPQISPITSSLQHQRCLHTRLRHRSKAKALSSATRALHLGASYASHLTFNDLDPAARRHQTHCFSQDRQLFFSRHRLQIHSSKLPHQSQRPSLKKLLESLYPSVCAITVEDATSKVTMSGTRSKLSFPLFSLSPTIILTWW